MDKTNANRTTIFVIDDDADVRRALGRLMRSAGWSVESFGNAQDFLARLPYDEVGCILLDVRMPGMSGPELQDRMLAMGISLPIIYLTGHADVPMSVHAMKNGAMDILLKPARDDVVLEAINTAIALHAAIKADHGKRIDIESRMSRLSAREREVMLCVIRGRLNKQIAADLGITEKTVKAHRARVMEKVETRSVAELVRLCTAVGIAPEEQLSALLGTGARRLGVVECP